MKPDLNLNFKYQRLEQYLNVSDKYDPSCHEEPKQKWWDKQKASELSQDFLPAVLDATDQVNDIHMFECSSLIK